MKTVATGLGVVFAWMSAGAAPAQKSAPPAKPAAASATQPRKNASADELTRAATKGVGQQKPRIIDFEDETIRGTLTKPEGDFIGSSKAGRQRSLIKIRRHFVPELLKSANEL